MADRRVMKKSGAASPKRDRSTQQHYTLLDMQFRAAVTRALRHPAKRLSAPSAAAILIRIFYRGHAPENNHGANEGTIYHECND